jgi:hypothetical protein
MRRLLVQPWPQLTGDALVGHVWWSQSRVVEHCERQSRRPGRVANKRQQRRDGLHHGAGQVVTFHWLSRRSLVVQVGCMCRFPLMVLPCTSVVTLTRDNQKPVGLPSWTRTRKFARRVRTLAVTRRWVVAPKKIC